jgi:O-antigen/teichoic acid export membrane protein
VLRRNVVVNLLGRGIALSLQVLLIPFYLRILGVDAVGLIGFYNTMFTAVGVVEYAIGGMIMREMARLHEVEAGAQLQRDLLRTTEAVYVLGTFAVGTAITVAAPAIVHTWLYRSTLGEDTLIQCVVLMGWTVTLQLFGSLYLNALNGLERQFRSNILSIALACVRGFGALIVLLLVSATIEAYFATQFVAMLFILVVFAVTTWQSLPYTAHRAVVRPALLLSTWHYTRSLTGVAILFVLLSQADKLIASAVLPLMEFGYYVIASMIASLMWTIYGSVGTALTPRFTRLIALRAEQQAGILFHSATQFMSLILLPVAVIAIFHAEPLIFLWTGDSSIAAHVAPLAVPLTIGTVLACLACASNCLQLAAGFTHFSLLNHVVWIVGLPLTYFATLKYGAEGATVMWLVGGVISLTVAPTLFHRRMLRGEQARWYLFDLAMPALVAGIVGFLSVLLTSMPSSRPLIGLQLILVWITTSFAVLLVCPALRIAAFGAARRSLALIRP